MKVYSLVGTEGNAAMDAALNDMGMWKETTTPSGVTVRYTVPVCGQCSDLPSSPTYDDGLCGACRDRNDERLWADRNETSRLIARINEMFPHMTSGQIMHMVASILWQQDVASVWEMVS